LNHAAAAAARAFPGAWITVTARRKAIDPIRAELERRASELKG